MEPDRAVFRGLFVAPDQGNLRWWTAERPSAAGRSGTEVSSRRALSRGRASTRVTTHCRDPASTKGNRRPAREARPPARRAPTGAAPQTMPRDAAPTRPIASRGRQPLAEGDGHDRTGAGGEAHHREGRGRQLPSVRRGHDQVARAGDDAGRDQGLGALESPDQPVRRQAAQQTPDGTDCEEEPVGARADTPDPRGEEDEHTGHHPLQPGQRRHHEDQVAQTVVGPEDPDALPDRWRGRVGCGGLRAEADEGNAGQHQRNGVGEERERLVDDEEPGPDDRTGESLRAGLGGDQHPVAVLQGVRRHDVGHDGLERGVVDRPAAGVEEHHEDEEGEVDVTAQNEVRADRNCCRSQHIGHGHERPAGEPVGEGTGGQGEQEPRDAVCRHHAGDRERIRVHEYREERDGSRQHAVAPTGQREAGPEPPERAAEPLAPDAMFRPTTNPHRTFASVLPLSLPRRVSGDGDARPPGPGATAAGAASAKGNR